MWNDIFSISETCLLKSVPCVLEIELIPIRALVEFLVFLYKYRIEPLLWQISCNLISFHNLSEHDPEILLSINGMASTVILWSIYCRWLSYDKMAFCTGQPDPVMNISEGHSGTRGGSVFTNANICSLFEEHTIQSLRLCQGKRLPLTLQLLIIIMPWHGAIKSKYFSP